MWFSKNTTSSWQKCLCDDLYPLSWWYCVCNFCSICSVVHEEEVDVFGVVKKPSATLFDASMSWYSWSWSYRHSPSCDTYRWHYSLAFKPSSNSIVDSFWFAPVRSHTHEPILHFLLRRHNVKTTNTCIQEVSSHQKKRRPRKYTIPVCHFL